MTNQTGGSPKSEKKSEKTAQQTAALSTDDLEKVSGGLNPQPLPPSHDPRKV